MNTLKKGLSNMKTLRKGLDNMKKMLSFTVVIILSMMCIVGCGGDPKQEELLNYVNGDDGKEMYELQKKLIESYGSVTGDNYKDDDTMYQEFEKNTITYANDLNEKATKIASSIEDEKLGAAHEKYLKYTSTMQSALTKFVEALKEQDPEKATAANDLISEANQYSMDYNDELEKLASEYGVELESGGTSAE